MTLKLKKGVDSFFKNRIMKLDGYENMYINVVFRIHTPDPVPTAKSVMSTISINTGIEDREYLCKVIKHNLELRNEGYTDLIINKVSFLYSVFRGKAKVNYGNIVKNQYVVNYGRFNRNKLCVVSPIQPLDMYGTNIYFSENKDGIEGVYFNPDGYIYKISQKKTIDSITNLVEVLKEGISVCKYTDVYVYGSEQWNRTVNSRLYFYDINNNNFVYMEQQKNTPHYINKLPVDKVQDTNIAVMDLETYIQHVDSGKYKGDAINSGVLQKVLVPYLLSYMVDDKLFSFFRSDYKDHNEMLETGLLSLFDYHIDKANSIKSSIEEQKRLFPKKKVIKNNNYKKLSVYLHNFAKFDSNFILGIIIQIAPSGSIKIVRNNGRLISVRVSLSSFTKNGDNYTITFYDSLHLLPATLKKLSTLFSAEDQSKIKGEFDHDKINNLNYENHKAESIAYCERDCVALYNVLHKFNNYVYEKWGVSITSCPTTSSLGFRIFRSNFLKVNKLIPQITDEMYDFIRSAYTGGFCFNFIPLFDGKKTNEQLYVYDINSMYAYIMNTSKMPCGNITYFEGSNPPKDKLGFYLCSITAPKGIKHPIIQIHIKNKTIAPVGTFKGIIFSEEMNNAIKYNYKFEIIKGLYFDKSEILFKEYTDEMTKIRSKFDKTNPFNYIAKLLNNSLYGRFALNTNFGKIEIINQKDLNTKLENNSVFRNSILDAEIFKVQGENVYLLETKDNTIEAKEKQATMGN